MIGERVRFFFFLLKHTLLDLALALGLLGLAGGSDALGRAAAVGAREQA